MTRPGRLAIVVLLLAGSGCGYHLSGGGSTIPQNIKVIAVLPFENRTNRPEIEQRVTEQVALELSRRGRYRIVASSTEADAVLEGAVTSYQRSAVLFNEAGRASRQEVVVALQATLRERSGDEVLWRQSGLIFKEQYEVPDTGDFSNLEETALDDLSRGAAGVLVTSILEGF